MNTSCNYETKPITQNKHYAQFLKSYKNLQFTPLEKTLDFWQKKTQQHPNQVLYLGPLAATYIELYEANGDINNLIKAENLYVAANKKTNYKNSRFIRALAEVYKSQHRFKECLQLLQKLDSIKANQRSTQSMTFDVYMELGKYKEAKTILNTMKKNPDFDYYIRKSKWMHHKGDLNSAIYYMNLATNLAFNSGNEQLICQAYSNLADYYGQSQRIDKAYMLYLKALHVNPNYVYALSKIAWIVFSNDKNVEEASKIIDVIAKTRLTPDLFLFKAELAEFNQETLCWKKNIEQYKNMISTNPYGSMYNTHNITIYAEDPQHVKMALEIALEEVKNKPTPHSYGLLAWAYFANGDKSKSLKIIQQYVTGKTFDPQSELRQAVIYKANGQNDKYKRIIDRLLKNKTFILGPNLHSKIEIL